MTLYGHDMKDTIILHVKNLSQVNSVKNSEYINM